MKDEGKYSYWKWPGQKWIALAGAAIWSIELWRNISDYQNISEVGEVIFSVAEFEKWEAQKIRLCALDGMAAAIFLGIFLIGVLSRSRRTAYLAEGVLLLVLGIGWGVAGFVVEFASSNADKIWWLLIFVLELVVGVYCIWKSRRGKTEG